MAIFLVIFTHSSGYQLFRYSSGLNQWLYMFITVSAQVSVPLFFMISGVLLLNKEESYRSLLGKRIKRFVIIVGIFELGLYALSVLKKIISGVSFDVSVIKIIGDILSGNLPNQIAYSYWFLYAYIGLLFMLPFLRYISKNINKSDFMLLIVLHFIIFSALPIINLILKSFCIENLNLAKDFGVPLATEKALFYALIGYYIDKNVDIQKLKKNTIIQLVFITLIGIFISSLCIYYEGYINGEYTHNYVQLFDYITAIVVFLLVKYLFNVKWNNIKEKYGNIISYIASLTFGIYLLEAYLRRIGLGPLEHLLEPIFPIMIVDIVWCMVCFIIGGIVTIIMKKIPYLRNLI